MAKSCNQKGKILYLQKMLSETTSEKPVTMQEILAKLVLPLGDFTKADVEEILTEKAE